ncbi:hypothetical protein Q5P01_020152 [Channa striata]|uniref:Uncharacterized protein n=1 Tax=Channa striata TaxID=64152 RepID=A0AA88S1M4_CHASR|nr:hypothetical protein Q5P01_020152 [Channa striata]
MCHLKEKEEGDKGNATNFLWPVFLTNHDNNSSGIHAEKENKKTEMNLQLTRWGMDVPKMK